MSKYGSFFRMRFVYGLQYRAAALAGMATQFAWGAMEVLMFAAFYQADAAAFPMTMQQTASYVWLQQAFLALFMSWFFDSETMSSITSGGMVYELCRPIGLYRMWYVKDVASRLSKAVLRCMPILLLTFFLPEPYGLTLPAGPGAAGLFVLTAAMSLMVVVAYCMLVYIATFFTMSPMGVRLVAISLTDFFAGAVIPLPFLPQGLQRVLEWLPFASMQNLPLRIYSGDIAGAAACRAILIQIFWLAALMCLGALLMKKALRRIVVQGG